MSIKGIRLLTSAATKNTNPHPLLITPFALDFDTGNPPSLASGF